MTTPLFFSLHSSYMHCPSPGHLETFKHVGRYILSTIDLGLQFTSKPYSSLESFIHSPLSDDDPTDPSKSQFSTCFCDANWGPQDASKQPTTNIREVSFLESRSICGHISIKGVVLSCCFCQKIVLEKRQKNCTMSEPNNVSFDSDANEERENIDPSSQVFQSCRLMSGSL
jgi:hypothetical protein